MHEYVTNSSLTYPKGKGARALHCKQWVKPFSQSGQGLGLATGHLQRVPLILQVVDLVSQCGSVCWCLAALVNLAIVAILSEHRALFHT